MYLTENFKRYVAKQPNPIGLTTAVLAGNNAAVQVFIKECGLTPWVFQLMSRCDRKYFKIGKDSQELSDILQKGCEQYPITDAQALNMLERVAVGPRPVEYLPLMITLPKHYSSADRIRHNGDSFLDWIDVLLSAGRITHDALKYVNELDDDPTFKNVLTSLGVSPRQYFYHVIRNDFKEHPRLLRSDILSPKYLGNLYDKFECETSYYVYKQVTQDINEDMDWPCHDTGSMFTALWLYKYKQWTNGYSWSTDFPELDKYATSKVPRVLVHHHELVESISDYIERVKNPPTYKDHPKVFLRKFILGYFRKRIQELNKMEIESIQPYVFDKPLSKNFTPLLSNIDLTLAGHAFHNCLGWDFNIENLLDGTSAFFIYNNGKDRPVAIRLDLYKSIVQINAEMVNYSLLDVDPPRDAEDDETPVEPEVRYWIIDEMKHAYDGSVDELLYKEIFDELKSCSVAHEPKPKPIIDEKMVWGNDGLWQAAREQTGSLAGVLQQNITEILCPSTLSDGDTYPNVSLLNGRSDEYGEFPHPSILAKDESEYGNRMAALLGNRESQLQTMDRMRYVVPKSAPLIIDRNRYNRFKHYGFLQEITALKPYLRLIPGIYVKLDEWCSFLDKSRIDNFLERQLQLILDYRGSLIDRRLPEPIKDVTFS